MVAKLWSRLVALSLRRRIAVGASVIVIAGGVAGGLAVTGGSAPVAARIATPTTTTVPTPTTTTVPPLTVPPGYCPLTDTKAPDGVPQRPALAVKVGNEPYGARPQSGLNAADIVFDTPAEGFIMRYIAVYQCQNAAKIGPDRSVRWVDWHVLRQLVHPIMAYAGGIGVNLNIVSGLGWAAADNLLINAANAGYRTTDRQPPDNLYTSTSALYSFSSAFAKKWGPPPPIFAYSATPVADATAVASMRINFSYDTDVIWTWNASDQLWIHSYSDGPDIDSATGAPVSASNVVVLVVKYRFGKYAEHIGGSGDFESETIGSGSGYILRDGKSVKITWSRRFVSDPWTFTDASGQPVPLSPGRTWVELLPNSTAAASGAVTITP